MNQDYKNVVTLEQLRTDPLERERVTRLTELFLPHLRRAEDSTVPRNDNPRTHTEQQETQS